MSRRSYGVLAGLGLLLLLCLLWISPGCGLGTLSGQGNPPGAGATGTPSPTPSVGALEIVTTHLANGTVYAPYGATLSARNGTPPYTWSIEAGRLPTGIILAPQGDLSGTPVFTETLNFTVKVTDRELLTRSREFSLSVGGTLRLLICEVLYDTPGVDSDEEWVEIFNPNNYEVDLAGWTLQDEHAMVSFPQGFRIPPNGAFLWAKNHEGFYGLYGFYPDLDGLGLNLDNDGDSLTLKDPQGMVADYVGWEIPGWEAVSAHHTTIERTSYINDGNPSPSYWRDSQNTGNPSIFAFAAYANRPPSADAGPNQVSLVGQSFQLDGASSSDPDGNPLSFLWDNGLVGPSPSMIYNSAGTYPVILTVSDGVLSSSDRTVAFIRDGGTPSATVVFNAPPRSRGIDEALVNLINLATSKIDAAFYVVNRRTIADALASAAGRGVSVRMVTEKDSYDNVANRPFYDMMTSAGVMLVTDTSSGLMHDKFLIADERYVWTGSYNASYSGTIYDSNDAVTFDSESLAVQSFGNEFVEMFVNRRFGAKKTNDPYALHSINGSLVECYFSPHTSCKQRLLEVITNASSSIHFCIYTFTGDELAAALIAKKNSGLEVKGVFDRDQVQVPGSEFENLRSAGVTVRQDNFFGLLHHKFVIIDQGSPGGSMVVTGSYNWTQSAATTNDENIVIIHDPAVVSQYYYLFRTIFEESTAP